MQETGNPYSPGQPVENPDLFVGRREVLSSIREHVVRGRWVFLIAGARRMGKSSLLRQVPLHLPEGAVSVQVRLSEEGAQKLDWLLWRLAVAIDQSVTGVLGLTTLEPAWADFEGHTEWLLDRFWPRVRERLAGRSLALLVDDLDSLRSGGGELLDGLAAFLALWRDRDASLILVITVDSSVQEELSRAYPSLFGGAPCYVLAPLSSEQAIRLITWPVNGILTYDYGVPRRLVEITSGQPYYLHLLCAEVFRRCASSGWVNQRDVDVVLETLVERDTPEFRQVWDESTPQEQAVLAALVSLRGARGVATAREVHDVLVKAGARPTLWQVEEALERLCRRDILEQLGALSYRFRVALLRAWLAHRLDLCQIARSTRWPAGPRGGRAGDRPVGKLKAARDRPRTPRATASPPEAGEAEGQATPRGRRVWPWLAAAVLAFALLGAAFATGLFRGPVAQRDAVTPALARTAEPSRTPDAVPTRATPPAVASSTAAPTPEPIPTHTPSPTAPLVVARAVPSIAFLSREGAGGAWVLSLMSSDGRDRVPLLAAPSDLPSAPSWSPDGRRIAFVSSVSGNADIWVVDVNGSRSVRLTDNQAKDQTPAWSPDANWIAFASVRDSLYYELYVMRPDGSDVQRLTWWEDASDISPTWSPDGTRLAFASKRDGNWEIYTIDRDGANLLRLTTHPADDRSPAWSPDGSRIAFESMRDGYGEIYVMPAAGGEERNLTSLGWANDLGPTWSPDGGRIAFYSDRDGEWDVYVMASDGSSIQKLTGDNTADQLPAWRP